LRARRHQGLLDRAECSVAVLRKFPAVLVWSFKLGILLPLFIEPDVLLRSGLPGLAALEVAHTVAAALQVDSPSHMNSARAFGFLILAQSLRTARLSMRCLVILSSIYYVMPMFASRMYHDVFFAIMNFGPRPLRLGTVQVTSEGSAIRSQFYLRMDKSRSLVEIFMQDVFLESIVEFVPHPRHDAHMDCQSALCPFDCEVRFSHFLSHCTLSPNAVMFLLFA
jgi:hypothetical protein